MIICVIYKPQNQTRFLKQITTKFEALDLNDETTFLEISMQIISKGNVFLINQTNLSSSIKNFHGTLIIFYSTYSFKQLIKGPTRTTCSTSTRIDYYLTNTQKPISQSGIIDNVVSDHSMICRSRNISAKYNKHKEITFRSLKNYLIDVFKEPLEKVFIPDYDRFDNLDLGYRGFIS